jgi:hypothetical protein
MLPFVPLDVFSRVARLLCLTLVSLPVLLLV